MNHNEVWNDFFKKYVDGEEMFCIKDFANLPKDMRFFYAILVEALEKHYADNIGLIYIVGEVEEPVIYQIPSNLEFEEKSGFMKMHFNRNEKSIERFAGKEDGTVIDMIIPNVFGFPQGILSFKDGYLKNIGNAALWIQKSDETVRKMDSYYYDFFRECNENCIETREGNLIVRELAKKS